MEGKINGECLSAKNSWLERRAAAGPPPAAPTPAPTRQLAAKPVRSLTTPTPPPPHRRWIPAAGSRSRTQSSWWRRSRRCSRWGRPRTSRRTRTCLAGSSRLRGVGRRAGMDECQVVVKRAADGGNRSLYMRRSKRYLRLARPHCRRRGPTTNQAARRHPTRTAGGAVQQQLSGRAATTHHVGAVCRDGGAATRLQGRARSCAADRALVCGTE
jgi:hypothetical protein